MFESWEPWRHFGPVQILDLAIVTVLFYLALVWLKHRASRALAGVLVLLGLLYGTARFLDMPFTLAVFREGFTVIAVALLLIFQKDLRWAFERLFSATPWGKREAGPSEGVIETVAESAGALAKSRTGALIVFEGSEPLDQHIRGGIPLDASVSLPLLLSVFDASSPGHDGAVVVRNGRATTFGAHLPLAGDELPESFGTRHSAGLGLAEVADAFVIVISEERGTISICRDGALEVVDSVAALKQRLKSFVEQHSAESRAPSVRRLLLKNWSLKLAAVLLAGMVSIVFADRTRTVERSYEVPVEFINRPQNWFGETPEPSRVRVTLSGSETAFELLDDAKLKISLNAEQLTEGTQSVRIRPRFLNVQTPLKIERIQPPEIHVTTYRLQPVKVNVGLPKVGLPPEGVIVERIELASTTATLLWPMKKAPPPRQILTEPLDLGGVTSSRTVELRLEIPSNAKPASGQSTTVTVKVQVRQAKPPKSN